MKCIYVAAPLGQGADRETNRAAAADWCGWIAETFNVAISADWVVLSGVWTEDRRELGLATDMEMVSRADEVWQVGPRVSPGMALEGEQARKLGKTVCDFTGLTREQIIMRTPQHSTPNGTGAQQDSREASTTVTRKTEPPPPEGLAAPREDPRGDDRAITQASASGGGDVGSSDGDTCGHGRPMDGECVACDLMLKDCGDDGVHQPYCRHAGKPYRPTLLEPRWRTGRTLFRTLYLDGNCVGMVDSPELAANIVGAMNGEAAEFRRKWLGAEAAAATANEALEYCRAKAEGRTPPDGGYVPEGAEGIE